MADAATRSQTSERTKPSGASVVLDEIHVRYRVAGAGSPRLRELFTGDHEGRKRKDVHALRGVSFTANAGDFVGVIGRNGSGKSTLLRTIAGLLPATSGRVWVAEQPRLLGVGAVLKNDLTGRENIVLGGTALGIRRNDVRALMGDIIEFSGLEEFIDMPMRTYSSGMKARLQFAIATAIEPEILLIDEALAVGDQEFKRRSQERIDDLLDQAGTVFLVTHSLSTVRKQCSRAMWLDKGQIQAVGHPDDVVDEYESATAGRDGS